MRKGAGRPKGSGKPGEEVRRNRIAVLLLDAEFEKLHRLAEAEGVPVGTMAYRIFAAALRRKRER